MPANAKASPYSPHPGAAYAAAIVGNFKQKTGKTLDEWVAFVKKAGPPAAKDRRAWLKESHELTTNYAWYVTERADGKGAVEDYDPDALVDAIFSAQKSHLRPLYEEMLHFGLALGKDVIASPCKTIIPFYRQHVFSQIRVPNKSRIDLGFAFRDLPVKGKLIDTGGFAKKDRITHRIEISSLADFNAEAKRWWKQAYDRNAPT